MRHSDRQTDCVSNKILYQARQDSDLGRRGPENFPIGQQGFLRFGINGGGFAFDKSYGRVVSMGALEDFWQCGNQARATQGRNHYCIEQSVVYFGLRCH